MVVLDIQAILWCVLTSMGSFHENGIWDSLDGKMGMSKDWNQIVPK
jgi:hypothetical protein